MLFDRIKWNNEISKEAIIERSNIVSLDINLLAAKIESLRDGVSHRENMEIQCQRSLPIDE